MRVLFAVLPGLGHLFPTVPLAWALRAAGHEVLFATAEEGVGAAVAAGLPAVETAPGLDQRAIFAQGVSAGANMAQELRERGKEMARAGQTPDFVLGLFARVADAMAGEMLRVARQWRPDLVVYTRFQGAGLLVARALGVPAVEHGFDFIRGDGFAARYLPHLAAASERLGVPEGLPEIESVHVAPPSLLIGQGGGLQMQYVPYNAGGALPDWMWDRPAGRPTVLVTVGTTMPTVSGLGSLAPVLAAAAKVDADFLLAFGGSVDFGALGPLPDNARPIGWVPLYQLLGQCAAIVHHGGGGTTLTSVAAGVPQLVLPHGGEDFVNAAVVAGHGLGPRREHGEVDPDTLTALVEDGSYRAAARAAADEVRMQPAPAALVPRLEALAGRATTSGAVSTPR